MKNFFQHVKYKYNNNTYLTIKQYCNENNKLARQSERLQFLLQCKKFGAIPPHLKRSTKITDIFTKPKLKIEAEKITRVFHEKILKLEIRATIITIQELRNNMHHNKKAIETNMDIDDSNSFTEAQKAAHSKIRQETKTTHFKKLNKMITTLLDKFGFTYNEDWFINTTNIDFPEEIKWLLSLGAKFAIPINKENFSPIKIITDIEEAILSLGKNKEREEARGRACNRVATYKNKIKNTEKEKFILAVYKSTMVFLKKHKDTVIVTTADKGNKTVIMYKKDYQTKMENLLDDKNTYKTMRDDPTHKLQNKNNNLINDLQKSEYISTMEKYQLHCSAAQAPKLYGLPKIHKEGTPLRPISASQKVPCYNLAKYTGKILQNLVSEEYNIKDVYQLKEKLQNIKIEDDEVLISYDVISLFTNIPVHTAINIIMKKWPKIQEKTNIPKSQFLKILQICLRDNNYFQFDNKIYQQIYGMPMGSPLSPTIANIVLDDLLDETLKLLNEEMIEIKVIYKYVDDFFAIIKKKDNEKILHFLNMYHNKLKFTSEIEENEQLPFLDARIHKKDNRIIFDWYRKELSSGRIINFHSTQPKRMVINTAKNFIRKILTISDVQFQNKNIEIIKDTLHKNSFPTQIINTLIEDFMYPNNQKPRNENDGNTKKFFSISYIPSLTDSKTMRAIINSDDARFAHKPNTTLRTLFTNTKGKTPKMEQNDVVYEIACKGSEASGETCDMFYIGQTKRTLKTRVAEHEADVKKGKQTTGLSQHMKEKKHTADFTNVKILDIEKRKNKRMTLESLRIQQKGELSMNTKEDINDINLVYSLVL